MDELDLVRLSRPQVDPLDDDALGRVRAASLGASVGPPPPDDGTAAPLVELAPPRADERARRGRRRLVAVGLAAAVLLAAGLALVVRERGADTPAGPPEDAALRLAIAGRWYKAFAADIDAGLDPGRLVVTFAADPGGALTVEQPCGIFVSRDYRIEDGALVLSEPLTSPEGGCLTPALEPVSAELLRLFASTPVLAIEGRTLTIGGSAPFSRDPDVWAPPTEPGVPTTVAPPSDEAGRALLDRLRGRTFEMTVFRQEARAVTLSRMPRITFGEPATLTTVCNGVLATASIIDDRLRFSEFRMTLIGCTGEDDVVRLFTDEPRILFDGTTLRLLLTTSDAEFRELVGGEPAPTTSIGLAPPSTSPSSSPTP